MKRKSLIKIICGIIFLLLICFLIYCFYPLFVDKNNNNNNKPGIIYIEDRNGIEITNKANKYGYKKEIEVNLESQFVKDLLLIEDKRFYNHFGISILSKLRALKNNIFEGKITSGASTITEQYIKNRFFLGEKRGYLQKLREATISLYYSIPYLSNEFGVNSRMENKNKLLNSYLQNVYFGKNIYGVGAAMEVFFGKNKLEDLTEEERVLLISLLNIPYADKLKDSKFSAHFDIVQERLGYEFERSIFKLDDVVTLDAFPFITNDLKVDENNRVSVDAKLQAFAENVVDNTLKELKKKNVSNAAVFAINPKNDEILIYMGSRDFYSKEIDGQVNVLNSPRQPGSTMKPFLYLLALEEGAGVNSLLIDIESKYDSFKDGTVYTSENYSLKEYGLVRFKKALGNSLNNASVRLARDLGLEKVYNYYKRYGFNLPETPEHYGYSLVLGNPSITLKDLVYSYEKLLDFEDDNKFLLYQILSDPDNRDISFGVNSILNTSIYQAVKTGTSSNFKDNLVVSYHPDFVIGVWVGNNDNSSMKGVTGITGAGYIWHQIVEEAIRLGYIKDRNIDIPNGITQKSYCLDQKCFRKELDYDRETQDYFSRVLGGIYSKKDLFSKITPEEEEYLRSIGFSLR